MRARTRTESDADDLLQDVFVRIHKRLPDLREPAKLQGWVYRIARNAVIDHYRTRKEHLPLDFEVEAEDPEGRDAVDLSASLRNFIAALPPSYREPLVRHEFQDEVRDPDARVAFAARRLAHVTPPPAEAEIAALDHVEQQ